jgi:hypothetical protein
MHLSLIRDLTTDMANSNYSIGYTNIVTLKMRQIRAFLRRVIPAYPRCITIGVAALLLASAWMAPAMFQATELLALSEPRSPIEEAAQQLFAEGVDGAYICSRELVRRAPSQCPPYGPGTRATRIDFLRGQLPDPLPTLAVEEIEPTEDALTPYTFAYVRPLPAAAYAHPEEAAAGLPPVREFLAGDNWVSVVGSLTYDGVTWYEINPGEFVRGDHIALTTPSSFSGIVLSEQPAYPFAWLNRDTRPATTPGGAARDDIARYRYDLVTLYAQEPLGSQLWYMIGPDQWIEQSTTARVDVAPPPEGVGPGEKWLEINTFEQTVAAYEGERMVFATLMSSGRPETWTPNGLTRIWGKFETTPMQNRAVTHDSPLWYYLEDVEWTQYFDGAYAIHAAYWHNSFGFTRSHGCVNLTIQDAKWLYEWTSPRAGSDETVIYSEADNPGTWVYVHMTPPATNILTSQ